jgi:hypothetical protein
MADGNIQGYIRDNLKKGFSRQDIIKKLEKAGYSQEAIKQAFNDSDSPKKSSPNLSAILAIVAIVLLIVISYVIVQPMLSKPKLEQYSENPLTNTIRNEMIDNRALVSSTELLDLFLKACVTYSADDTSVTFDQVIGDCEPFDLLIVAGRLNNDAQNAGVPISIEGERGRKLNHTLSIIKSSLMGSDRFEGADSLGVGKLISVLILFDRLSSAEKETLTAKYLDSIDRSDLANLKCKIYSDEVDYFKLSYSSSTISQASSAAPVFASKLDTTVCRQIQNTTYDQFCTDGYGKNSTQYYVCNYIAYMNIMDFCQALTTQGLAEATAFAETYKDSDQENGYCVQTLTNLISEKSK